MTNLKSYCIFIASLVLLVGCQSAGLQKISSTTAVFIKETKETLGNVKVLAEDPVIAYRYTVDDIIADDPKNTEIKENFIEAIRIAVNKDPSIAEARQQLAARRSNIEILKDQKNIQVSGTLYGGIEDLTDNVSGAAFVLNANKLLTDRGILNARIEAEKWNIEAGSQALKSRINERALVFASLWIDLERFKTLNDKLSTRLGVLSPIITQLEEVALAGIGDVSQVAAAQRTISMIRISQTDVSQRYQQAQLNFLDAFGGLPTEVRFDENLISQSVPDKIDQAVAVEAPMIRSKYAYYKAAEATTASIRAKAGFNLSLQARASRPFGGSEYDSDEALGLVLNKQLFGEKKLKPELEQAEAQITASISGLRAAHRDGRRMVKNAQQTIKSMNKAILIAEKNAKITAEEITYLRQQLVIGGSTLESVLSAEARLYDAEANKVNFLAEKRKAEVLIVSTLGLLSNLIGL